MILRVYYKNKVGEGWVKTKICIKRVRKSKVNVSDMGLLGFGIY